MPAHSNQRLPTSTRSFTVTDTATGGRLTFAIICCMDRTRAFSLPLMETTNPHPDAWCSKCQQIRVDHAGEWNETSEALIKVRLLCGDFSAPPMSKINSSFPVKWFRLGIRSRLLAFGESFTLNFAASRLFLYGRRHHEISLMSHVVQRYNT